MSPKRQLSPRGLRRLMNLYPPLFFNGIRCLHVADDFHAARVRVRKRWYNRNLYGGVFGGTLLMSLDPWIGVLLWQILQLRKQPAIAVVKSLEADMLKPIKGEVHIQFEVKPEQVDEIIQTLQAVGKYEGWFEATGLLPSGEPGLRGRILMHVRRKQKPEETQVGF